MGSSHSTSLADRIPDFAKSNIDRRPLHDQPWLLALAEIGDTNEEALGEFISEATDQELHCCRAFYRAYRHFLQCVEEGDEKDFGRALYYTVAQSPSQLVLFYTILHHCWLLDIDTLEPQPELAATFIQASLDLYIEEKGKSPEEVDSSLNDPDEMLHWMRELVTTYINSILEFSSNPDLMDAQISSFGNLPASAGGEEVRIWTLRAADDSIELRVSNYGASVVSCRVRNEKSNDWIQVTEKCDSVDELMNQYKDQVCWRAAEHVENSSGSMQTFYFEPKESLLRVRMSFSVATEGKLTIRRNAESATGLLQTGCLWTLDRDCDFEELTPALGEFRSGLVKISVVSTDPQLHVSRKSGHTGYSINGVGVVPELASGDQMAAMDTLQFRVQE